MLNCARLAIGFAVLCLTWELRTAAAADSAPEPSADAIVKRADDVMDPGDYVANIEMKVKRQGEDDRVYRMTMRGSGSDKMLIAFDFPPREKGQAFLRSQDDLWVYLPNINKTLRIPKRQAFAGSDFSNHDMLNVRLQQDYLATRLADEAVDGVPCFCLMLVARNKSAPYASIKYWVRKNDFWPAKRVFYAVSGQAFKTLILKSAMPGPRPDTFVMSNVLEKNKLTEMVMSNLKHSPNDPAIFTESYLIRRR